LAVPEYDMPCVTAEGAPTGRVCSLGSGRRTVVGFGDSHMQMWGRAVDALVARGRFRFVPMVELGCTAARWAGSGGPHAPACRAWYRWAVSQVRRLRPDVLLIATEYASEKLPADQVRAELGIWRLVAELRPYVGRVVVVEDPPGVRDDPTFCLLAPGADLASCTTTWAPSHFATSDALRAAAKRRGYAFMRTRGWFCAGLDCPTVVGNTIVYNDRDHLTSDYVADLATPFDQAFLRALSSRR
jgi:hypothetical protein